MTPSRRSMIEDMTLRIFTARTIQSYNGFIARFARYFDSSPEHLGPDHARAGPLDVVQQRRAFLSYYTPTRSALR
jgi:hypothetical protein